MRDFDMIETELLLADLQTLGKKRPKAGAGVRVIGRDKGWKPGEKMALLKRQKSGTQCPNFRVVKSIV